MHLPSSMAIGGLLFASAGLASPVAFQATVQRIPWMMDACTSQEYAQRHQGPRDEKADPAVVDDIVRVCRDKVDPSHKFIRSYVEQLRDDTRRQYGLPAASRDDPLYPTAISIDVPRPNVNGNSGSGTPIGNNGALGGPGGFPIKNWKDRVPNNSLNLDSGTRLQLPSSQRINRSGFVRSDEVDAEGVPIRELLASAKGNRATKELLASEKGNRVTKDQIPTTEMPPTDNFSYDRD